MQQKGVFALNDGDSITISEIENSSGKSSSNSITDPACLRVFYDRLWAVFASTILSLVSPGKKEEKRSAWKAIWKSSSSFFFFPLSTSSSEKRKIEIEKLKKFVGEKRGRMMYRAREIDATSGECLVSRDSLQLFGYFWIAGLITSRCVLMKLVSCSLSCLESPRKLQESCSMQDDSGFSSKSIETRYFPTTGNR